jgi:aryl carrier-like protein
VLRVDEVKAEDNFFDLGGHSLAAMRVVSSARERGLDLSLRAMLSDQDLRSIARACRTE